MHKIAKGPPQSSLVVIISILDGVKCLWNSITDIQKLRKQAIFIGVICS